MFKIRNFKYFFAVAVLLMPVLVFANGDDHDHDASLEVTQEVTTGIGVGDPVWWGLFLGSVVLIVLLSWGVRKYLTVK